MCTFVSYSTVHTMAGTFPPFFCLAINRESKIMTMVHGDPWFNNMFFKDSEGGEVEDILMFDLQVNKPNHFYELVFLRWPDLGSLLVT